MTSFYEEYLWAHQARDYFGKDFEKAYEKYTMNVDVRPDEQVDGTNIPSFEEMLQYKPKQISLSFQIHLFQDITQKNHKTILKPIEKLLSTLIDNNIKDGALVISFYDESYFEEKSIDQYTFGYTSPSMDDFEEVEKDKWKGKILIKYHAKSSVPSSEELFNFYTEKPYSFSYHML
jgi:hypothetical protein